MRRLPVYLLLDTSGSMHGEPIEAVKNGVEILISSLRQDPYALETAYLAIISFDTTARQLMPLTEISMFQPPQLQATGTTQLGDALALLATKIDQEVQKTTPDARGDWKPLVFIMTDGAPTDDWKIGFEKLKQVKTGMIIACAAGHNADTTILKQITEVVVELATADSNAIKAFFKWVSASISVGSQKVDAGQKEVIGLNDLPPPPPEVNVVL
ncbi:vWA domain-containing protein [Acinetobacter sp. ANC 3832]|uniref:vWA domain-containing protein n=1 Tax=Acinetobacter sp. ANC 3832 TaxID=1977874 RepID=UPI000A331A4B|nr:VWA domain-containing protein [Acinetobacter sp. ANC 3832]OTG92797.1 tellurium resistance protein TerY [Acinetobacter sp. ANC 3832]